jgi:AcrR family transcriptional regulator
VARSGHAGLGSPARRGARERRPAQLVARTDLPRDRLREIQRSRLLAGTLAAVEQHGYAGTQVSHITRCARVSRRTFYELFENREACLAALVEDIVANVEAELARAALANLPWRERVRGGLCVMLAFFDRQPALARVCVVQALHAGPRVQARRERVFVRLAAVLDEGRGEGAEPRSRDCTPLTAEGLVGAAFGIVHARLARRASEPLAGLVGDLMSMIVLPYLGPAAARAEQSRAAALPVPAEAYAPLAIADSDPLQALPMRVTYRTARVLEYLAGEAGVSNRGVADAAGIKDQGQVSKLLSRLERLGLLQNEGEGAHTKGEPNAWQLTPLGERVAQRLHMNPVYASEAA